MEMDRGPEARVKGYTVAQAVARLHNKPSTVSENDTLLQVAKAAVHHPYCRTIAVVDREGRLVGVIPLSSLVDDVFVHIMPEEFLDDAELMERITEMAKRSEARTARELMGKPVGIALEDSVKEAFTRMHHHSLEGLPIVDGKGHVIGYLDKLELLAIWVDAKGPRPS